jgi:hypothetical protein
MKDFEQDREKAYKVVKSCQTSQQFICAVKYLTLFARKHYRIPKSFVLAERDILTHISNNI